MEEVQKETADLFAAHDLYACLEMLGSQGMLEDLEAFRGEFPAEWSDFLRPQTNFFRDVSAEPEGFRSGS